MHFDKPVWHWDGSSSVHIDRFILSGRCDLSNIGCDREAVLAGMQDAPTKSRLIRANDEAIRKGVFGSPFFLVDGEPFWGSDRIALLAQR